MTAPVGLVITPITRGMAGRGDLAGGVEQTLVGQLGLQPLELSQQGADPGGRPWCR